MKNWKPVILSIAIAAGWSVGKAQASDVQPKFVTTYVVEAAQRESSRRFLGVLAAKDTVTLSFQVGGQLLELDAVEGSVVEAGSNLAALDLGPFERAVRRAEISLEQAERDLDRNQKLAQTNAVSAVAVENALTIRDLAVVSLEDAMKALSDAQLRVPFPSLVADRIGVPFTTIEAGQPVVRLHDVSETRVELNIPERFVQAVDLDTLEFAVEIPGFNDRFAAQFEEIRTEASTLGQNYLVNLSIPAKAGRLFVPGTTVTVIATVHATEAFPEASSIPNSAIIINPDRSASVMVLEQSDEGLIVTAQPVEVSTKNGTDIHAHGLEIGTEIVRVGAHLLSDGQAVKRYAGLIIEEQ